MLIRLLITLGLGMAAAHAAPLTVRIGYAIFAISTLSFLGAGPPPPSPELLARCERDYALWSRYHHNQYVIHTGQRAKAELALYRCQQGQYHPWIEDLEDMLRRGKVPLPSD